MMVEWSSAIELTIECGPDWSFLRIVCIDLDRTQLVRIAKVALHDTNGAIERHG